MRASIVPLTHRSNRRRRISATASLVLPVLLASALLIAFVSRTDSLALRSETSPSVVPRAHNAEPLFREDVDRLLWFDDFDKAEVSVVPSRPREDSRYGRYVTVGAQSLRFEPRAGVDGSGALRIDWPATPVAARTAQAPCSDDARLVEASFPPTRELIVQYAVRYTPGFVFDWGSRGRCHGNAKKLLLVWAREGSRFVFIAENGALGVGSDHDHPLFDQNRAVTVTPASLADGRWHRITFRIRQSSTPQRADGAIYGWIDGVQRWAYEGIVTHNGGGYNLFKMPATFNQGSPVAQTEWLDALRVWRPM